MIFTVTFTLICIFMPVLMIVSGYMLINMTDDINSLIGYRSKRSMASQEAWNLANSFSGRYLSKLGMRCLPIFFLCGVIVGTFLSDFGFVKTFIIGIVIMQLVLFLSVIPYTEIKLKREIESTKINK